jgi:hypothetical protein
VFAGCDVLEWFQVSEVTTRWQENAVSRPVMDNMNPAPSAGKVIRAPSLKRGKNEETRIGDRVSAVVCATVLHVDMLCGTGIWL